MIKIILVPLDGNEHSADVLDTALVIANRFNAHIKAVHVREHTSEPFMFSGMPASYRKEFAEMSSKAVDSVEDTVPQQFVEFCARESPQAIGVGAGVSLVAHTRRRCRNRVVARVAPGRRNRHVAPDQTPRRWWGW